MPKVGDNVYATIAEGGTLRHGRTTLMVGGGDSITVLAVVLEDLGSNWRVQILDTRVVPKENVRPVPVPVA